MIVERQLPLFSMRNKNLQSISNNAGCYYCCKIFESKSVINYTDEGETALCPHCGIDAVIFDCTNFQMNVENLQKAKKYWF